MKKLAINVFSILFFLIFAVNVNAVPIPVEVISNSSHVWGSYSLHYQSIEPFPSLEWGTSDSYDISGTAPQSGAISYTGTGFMPSAEVRSDADFFTASHFASVWNGWGTGDAMVGASTTTTFKPLEDFNTLNLYASNWEPR